MEPARRDRRIPNHARPGSRFHCEGFKRNRNGCSQVVTGATPKDVIPNRRAAALRNLLYAASALESNEEGRRNRLPLAEALKDQKRKAVNGKPRGTATTPIQNECPLIQPKTKSATAPAEKKMIGLRRFIRPALCSIIRNEATAGPLLPIPRHRLLPRLRFEHYSILQQLARVLVIKILLIGRHQQMPAPS
jgi:hypothetical protein